MFWIKKTFDADLAEVHNVLRQLSNDYPALFVSLCRMTGEEVWPDRTHKDPEIKLPANCLANKN